MPTVPGETPISLRAFIFQPELEVTGFQTPIATTLYIYFFLNGAVVAWWLENWDCDRARDF